MQLPVGDSNFAGMQRMLATAQKRRRRRRAALWLVAGLFLLGGGINGGYMYYNTQPALEQGIAEKSKPFNDSFTDRAKQQTQPGNSDHAKSSVKNNSETGSTGIQLE